MRENILIIGKGNILLRDEGIGIHVVRRIRQEKKSYVPGPNRSFLSWADTEIMESGTSFLDILGELAGRTKVIIIDAVQTQDDAPGTIYRFTQDDLEFFHTGSHYSLHHTSLPDLLYLTSFLDIVVPDIVIIGVNVKEISPGEELSKELESKVQEIINVIHTECVCFTDN